MTADRRAYFRMGWGLGIMAGALVAAFAALVLL